MARQDRAELGPVSDEGKEVTRRRERLGMHKNELAEAAGVSRATLAAIEGGEGYRRASLTKIERALDEAEAEAGMTAPPRTEEATWPAVDRRRAPDTPTVIRVRNDLGEVVIEASPNTDRAQMVADAEALLMALVRVNRQVATEDAEPPQSES